MNSSSIAQSNARDAKTQRYGEWLPIETAPRDGTYFLSCVAHGDYPLVALRDGDGGVRCARDGDTFHPQPTHWMHLPEPPRDQQAAGEGSRETI